MDGMTLEEYNGFLVDGSVIIPHPNSNHWQSLGGVYSAKTRSPLVQIGRIEGQTFDSKEAAIQAGLTLPNGGSMNKVHKQSHGASGNLTSSMSFCDKRYGILALAEVSKTDRLRALVHGLSLRWSRCKMERPQ